MCAAQVLLAALDAERIPRRLVLGVRSAGMVAKALRQRLDEVEAWRAASAAADQGP